MEYIFKHLVRIATLISIIVGCVTIYFAFYEKKVKLDVQTTYAENLTEHETVQDLSVKYYYYDSLEVHNLWKMQWVVRNTGDKTIIGHGSNSQILSNDGIPLEFNADTQILSLVISNSNNGAILQNRILSFNQWRRGEYVEITALIESINQPEITISDRYIVDSEISYSKFSLDLANQKNNIAEYIPRWLSKTLKIIYYILATFVSLVIIYTSFFSKENNLYNKIAMIILLMFMLIPLLWIIHI